MPTTGHIGKQYATPAKKIKDFHHLGKHQTSSNSLRVQRNEEVQVYSMEDAVLQTQSELGPENENTTFLKY